MLEFQRGLLVRAQVRLAAAVTLMLVVPVGSPSLASAAPKGPASLRLDHDDPLVSRLIGRSVAWGRNALRYQKLLLEWDRKWRSRQVAYAGGMVTAGGVLTAMGGLMWSLITPPLISGWVANRREYLACRNSMDDLCGLDGIDLSGLFFLIFGPPMAASLVVGVPLLVAGVVRRHLAKHPGAAPRLRKVGAGLGWSGLGVVAVGLFLSFFIPDNYDAPVPLGVLVGSNVSLLGLVVGLTGAAIWAEAQRGQALREKHRFRDHLRWKTAVDREARARQEATRRAGLPRAHIWTFSFQLGSPTTWRYPP